MDAPLLRKLMELGVDLNWILDGIDSLSFIREPK